MKKKKMTNPNKETDPRVIRTRQMLKAALVELLQEMDMEKISVNSLAKRATINRVTFYLHYRDLPDMLEKMAEEMIHEISILFGEPIAKKQTHEDIIQMLEKFLQHIADHATFFKTILTSRSPSFFKDRLLTFIKDWLFIRIESIGSDSFVQKADIQKDILLWYNSAAFFGTVQEWLRNDMPYTPSFLARQFYLIHKRGIG